ncbi:glycoside hydrolase N-terminal domain-containing protein [Xanthomonas sp. NCPPB 3005]|uniref:glycosyl hydrolase family 95 catalytic domain-containing protein n=1 Tax=Xanthomonas sp. NCPPB 3005 TaxID=3240913 RepID=UPI0035120ED3
MSDSEHAPGHAARRAFLKQGGALAAMLPLLGLPAFGRTLAAPLRPARSPLVPPAQALRMRYASAANEADVLRQGLPIGNGRLGALVGGAPDRDFLYLSDASLWTGGRNDVLDAQGQFPYEKDNFGSFVMLAKLYLELDGHAPAQLRDYARELDLSNGCMRVHYALGSAQFTRTVFASHPYDALVIQLEQRGGGRHSGRLRLVSAHAAPVQGDASGQLGFSGALANGLRHGAHVQLIATDGNVELHGDTLHFRDCSALRIVVCGGSNYVPDLARNCRDPDLDPQALARQRCEAAARLAPEALLYTHVADYRALFDGMQVDLGRSSPAQRKLDLWERLQARAAADTPDPELEALYLQFGRYLTIAASRDALPINLQGLWLENNDPPWMSDYHSDVNLQMNYWLTDAAGLAPCFDALARYCLAQLPAWTQITQAHFNDPRNRFRNTSGKVAGWAVAFSTNPFGGSGWSWHPGGNAWLCDSLWQHYEYTQDRAYLARIYPLLKGACEFWQARLIELEVTGADGRPQRRLVDDHDWSPEHGPEDARGIAYAQELAWNLFGQYRQASALLDRDAAYAATVAELQRRLYLPEISPSSGQLQEWMSPDDLGEAHHRHLSPLMGLYPGHRLHPDLAPPEQVAAARKLLEARGMHSFGWACAWRALCWARLGEAERAYALVATNLKPSIVHSNGTAPNFFDIYDLSQHGDPTLGGVFQIDANFGTPAAMLEMLLYSRPGHIALLPALPKAWAERGRVTGIGARGGFVVDLEWRDGKATRIALRSVGGTRTEIAFNGTRRTVELAKGGRLQVL